jgi:hypothetical protein
MTKRISGENPDGPQRCLRGQAYRRNAGANGQSCVAPRARTTPKRCLSCASTPAMCFPTAATRRPSSCRTR